MHEFSGPKFMDFLAAVHAAVSPSAKLEILHKTRQRGTAAAGQKIWRKFNRKNSNINLWKKARSRSRAARYMYDGFL
jgi:hypothetical protein